MTTSKFLEYQDTSGTGLVEECEEITKVEEPICEDCKCTSNGAAIAPNWHLLSSEETYLNEKNCLYQVVIETKLIGTLKSGVDTLGEIQEEYIDQAVEALLEGNNKEVTYTTRQTVKTAIESTDYYLAPRAKSRLRLLYSVPFNIICGLIEAAPGEEDATDVDEEAEEAISAGDVEIGYTIQDLKSKLIRVRKGLHLYGIYAKKHLAKLGEGLYVVDSETPFKLSNYGDMGILGGAKKTNLMAKMLPQLDKFLNKKGYNIRGVVGGGSIFGKTVDKVIFKFNKEYGLKELKIYTVECGNVPIEFKGKKLNSLKKESAWKDPTAMAYLTKLDAMLNDLTAREPKPWLEFVKEHTYPQVHTIVNRGYENTAPDPDDAVGKAIEMASCITQALMNEGKQLGQDIFDEDFNITDIFVEKLQEQICLEDTAAVEEQKEELKISSFPPELQRDIRVGRRRNTETSLGPASRSAVRDAALAQAYMTLDQDDAVFDDLCAMILEGRLNGNLGWDDFGTALNAIRLCGVQGMMKDAITCLMGGLTLEEALSSITEAAFRAMAIEDFGNFFIGLPPEKQAELDALVKQKFENGEFFKEGSTGQNISDNIAGKLDYTKPWEKHTPFAGKSDKLAYYAHHGTEAQSSDDPWKEETDKRRTLLEQLDFGAAAKEQLSEPTVFEAYIVAVMELYSDKMLELAEELNKFPGAQLFADAFAAVDCPAVPIADPSFFEWVKDKQLPTCGGTQDWTLPAMKWPFHWVPELNDPTAILFETLKFTVKEAYYHILSVLFVKICEIIGGAACGSLTAVGDGAAAIGDRSGVLNAIRDSICGDDATDEQIDNAVVGIFSALGLGADALADTQQVTDFAEDIGGSVTSKELCDAFLGEPSAEFLEMVTALIKYEYPDFEEALNNYEAITTFFSNMGNLMPASFREELSACSAGQSTDQPANPSLCATPEQIEDFCNLRTEILTGRATEEQIAKLCERPVDDLKDLASMLQGGMPELPPLVSDPGCDNGMLPYESDEQITATTVALNSLLEQLKVDFAYDMLGNGPGEQKWGLINMILSDTMGNPYTAHSRKANNRNKWVDFYMDDDDAPDDDDGNLPNVKKQRGAFPYKVAAWLQDYMNDKMTIDFVSSNDAEDVSSFSKLFEDLGITTFGGDLEKRKLPNLGHNIEIRADFENQKVVFKSDARKKDPDLTLSFEDNLKGLHTVGDMYARGFNLEFYLSDIATDIFGNVNNIPSDNARIKITNKSIEEADLNTNWPSLRKTGTREKAYTKNDELDTGNPSLDLKFEFLATDNTLEEVDLTEYPKFLSAFKHKQEYLPQVVLLHEMIDSGDVTEDDVKEALDEATTSIMTIFKDVVADADDEGGAWLYGATYDDLSKDDIEYVIANDIGDYEAGTSYHDVEITDDDGVTRKIQNKDQIMGISAMQHNVGEEDNRVIYLDPMTFGGSYMNPPLYIKPLENKAWLGLIDVMFPELSPCKPYRTDLIDFGDIQQKISDTYASIPEDPRLKSDPNCVVEVPYARILERPSASGLEGLITATIRIYVSAYFIQSMATFTRFNPSFPDVFSNIYAAYIVEEMEASFTSANHPAWQKLNPFKDLDFWYKFLEQSVQLYDRRYRNGEIDEPPSHVIEACVRLNNMQEAYEYALKREEAPDIGFFETLKHYRTERNLDAVKETEDDAKIVLRELVIEQLNYMGEKFTDNLKIVGMAPAVYNLDHFFLQNAQGGEALKLDQEIREEYSVITEGSSYTTGDEFALSDGSGYIGYYHVETDDDGNPLYITGEDEGEDAEGETLFPMVNITTVPIGDIEELGYEYDTGGAPFVLEKYISINGTPTAPSTAVETIKSAGEAGDNISDIYPGTLELVTDRNGRVVGIEGELGVRHGLRLSIIIGDSSHTITEVEVDALDLKLSQVDPLNGNSKLLLCLINKLTADDKFKLVAQYIFPLRKFTAMLAIYNGLAFLPSIGEKVVGDGETYGSDADDVATKPGVSVEVDEDGVPTISHNTDNEGAWAAEPDRNPGPLGAMGYKPWDRWEQLILRNSKGRIKRIFRSYYNSRDFDASGSDDSDGPGSVITNEFKERFKSAPGQDLLPWWKARMLRTNPFNASGELCEEKD